MNYFETKNRQTVLNNMVNTMKIGDKLVWALYCNNKLIKKGYWKKITDTEQTPNMFAPAIFTNGQMMKYQGTMIDMLTHEHLSSETDTYRLEIDLETK